MSIAHSTFERIRGSEVVGIIRSLKPKKAIYISHSIWNPTGQCAQSDSLSSIRGRHFSHGRHKNGLFCVRRRHPNLNPEKRRLLCICTGSPSHIRRMVIEMVNGDKSINFFRHRLWLFTLRDRRNPYMVKQYPKKSEKYLDIHSESRVTWF